MRRRLIVGCCFVLFSLISAVAQKQTPEAAKSALSAGVAAYKTGDYAGAALKFREAVRLDPDFVTARLYLATTLAQQYVPGADEAGNVKLANDAIEQYQEVLKRQGDSINSMKGIAYLHMQLKRFEEAKQYYKRALAVEPKDPELYYSIGVIDWTEAYREIVTEKSKMDLRPGDTLIFQPACRVLRGKQLSVVDEGLEMLAKAISLREDYDDAMAYVNLLYRIRADLQCTNPQASKADLHKADEWVDLAMAARKKKVESATRQRNF
jgi:tetratricopeptide (TPR) repeat protein